MMHGFWHFNDPAEQQLQIGMFMKNTSMLGAAFLIAWFGAGPLSFDERKGDKQKEPYKERPRPILREKVES
jgi:putative oxidoreductase